MLQNIYNMDVVEWHFILVISLHICELTVIIVFRFNHKSGIFFKFMLRKLVYEES